jgi:hypothetical protein
MNHCVSQVDDHGGAQQLPCLFLFDLDDTLLPTEWLLADYPGLPVLGDRPGHEVLLMPPRVDVAQVVHSMRRLLSFCCRKGAVHVVSRAEPCHWLRPALNTCLERRGPLSRVKMHSSRHQCRMGIRLSKFPFFYRLVNPTGTRWRSVFVIGDGQDELQSGEELRNYCLCPVHLLKIPHSSLPARALIKEHQRVMDEINSCLGS